MSVEIHEISFWDEHELNKGGMRIEWSSEKGFGQLDLVLRKDGKVFIGDEFLGREFVKEVLGKIVDGALCEYEGHSSQP